MTPPYHADSHVDESGSNDGIVCAKQIDHKTSSPAVRPIRSTTPSTTPFAVSPEQLSTGRIRRDAAKGDKLVMRRSVASAMLGALLTLAAAAAHADPTPAATGCPSAYERLAVSGFAAPYVVPAMVDSAGNGNGFVCALPLPDAKRDARCRILADPSSPPCQLQALGLPVYQFMDDDNAAANTPAGS